MCEWRPVVGFSGYEVSDTGLVRSIDRTMHKLNKWGTVTPHLYKGRMIKPWITKDGYFQLELNHGKKMVVHRLVAMAFVPGDFGLTVNHKNGNKTDNRPDNLEWVSAVQNTMHAAHELKCFVRSPVAVRLTKQDAGPMEFRSISEAAKHLMVHVNAVAGALSRGGKCRGYRVSQII
jgi:hypothetical protein